MGMLLYAFDKHRILFPSMYRSITYRDCPMQGRRPTEDGEAKMCKKSRLAISSLYEFLVTFETRKDKNNH